MFNPYPKGFNPTALNIPRLIPLLELLWNGVTFDIIKGKPLINGKEVTLDQAEPYAGAIAHLFEVPISRYQSLKPVIKNRSNGGFPSQTIFHYDLNKQCCIGQSFNKNPATNKTRISNNFGCNAKEKNHAIQKFWRKCEFPVPERWSKLSLRPVGSKFLTGKLTTYKKSRELKYVNSTVEPVFLTFKQIEQAIPDVLKNKNSYTGITQIVHRNFTTVTQLIPTYDTYHSYMNSIETQEKSAFQDYMSAYKDKRISHSLAGVESNSYNNIDIMQQIIDEHELPF